MQEDQNYITGLRAGIIGDEVFEREISLCRKLNRENHGKCCWGECKNCGVIPLLHKLCKGKLLEGPEDLEKAKKDVFGE